MTLPKAICVDLDGCLADYRHRLAFVEHDCPTYKAIIKGRCDDHPEWKPDWDAFYNAMDKDGVHEWCSELIFRMPYKVLFLTGRPEKFRNKTESWLYGNNPEHIQFRPICDDFELFMRPDYLPAVKCKCLPPEYSGGVPCIPCQFGSTNAYRPDHRPAHEVKREIYENHIAGKYEVLFCLDDDERVCEMYRELGLTVLRVMT